MGSHRLEAHKVAARAEESHPRLPTEFDVETAHSRIAVVQNSCDGLPFLFLHGNSACKEVFSLQFGSDFGQRHRYLAIDLPGHGKSGDAHKPAETYSIAGYADAAIEVLEALDLDQVAIIGWSLGGHIALEMMARFPGVVGIMLAGTPPLGHGMAALMQAYRPHDLTNLLAQPRLSDDDASRLAQAVVGQDYAALAEPAIKRTDERARPLMFGSLMSGAFEDEIELVSTYETAVAVVAGVDDPFVNTDHLAAIAYANLWGGVCHLLPGAGHAPFLAQPQLFDRILTQFASEMEVRANKLRETPQLAYSG